MKGKFNAFLYHLLICQIFYYIDDIVCLLFASLRICKFYVKSFATICMLLLSIIFLWKCQRFSMRMKNRNVKIWRAWRFFVKSIDLGKDSAIVIFTWNHLNYSKLSLHLNIFLFHLSLFFCENDCTALCLNCKVMIWRIFRVIDWLIKRSRIFSLFSRKKWLL